ncbi:MAG: hypothetical protein GY913_07445 [Proteobacteria bacterium]|nr:hypothetical protein [Pseudomonadota bacterium]MCP4916744.1 hypothetical protein [Pseudomonadota bacterium]
MTLVLLFACSGFDQWSPDEQAVIEETEPPFGGETDLDTTEPVETGLNNNKPEPDSDDTEPPADSSPIINAFAATEEETKVRFAFAVDDADNDLNGGSARVEIGASIVEYAWPSEIRWTDGGSPFVLWELDEFSPENTVTATLIVQDAAGHNSQAKTTDFTRSSWTRSVSESGDLLEDAVGLGQIETPATITGDLYGTGNDGALYTSDLDFMKFSVDRKGPYDITLTWTETAADYDLYLLAEGPVTIANAATYDYPETVSYSLESNTSYFLAVGGWDGRSGAWSIRIE